MAWRATKGDERYLWGGLFSPMPYTFPATEHLQELWGGPPGLRRASTPACSVARRAGPGGPPHNIPQHFPTLGKVCGIMAELPAPRPEAAMLRIFKRSALNGDQTHLPRLRIRDGVSSGCLQHLSILCPSCGTKFGHHDVNSSIDELCATWLRNGARWWSTVNPEPETGTHIRN